MTTPHAHHLFPPQATATPIDASLCDSVRMAAAGVLEATSLHLATILAAPDRSLSQVINAGLPQDDFTLDDAVATITHLVLTCLAHIHQGRGLLDGIPDLPPGVETLADCLHLVDRQVGTWTEDVVPPSIELATVRSAARNAADAAVPDRP